MAQPVIHIGDLCRHYQMGDTTVRALDHAMLDVMPGDFLMIVGSSGSGKSTLMHLLGLLDVPTSGILAVNGQNVAESTEAQLSALRNEHIGFVFQAFHLLSDLTVVENIALPLVYRGVPRAERMERARDLAIQMGLSKRLNHHPKELSGGQLQRIAIARALIGEPDILLADEPTGNLDSATSREIMNVFYDLNAQGHTIIMVTHDPKLADQGTRKVTLLDGKVVEDVPGKRAKPVIESAPPRRFPAKGSGVQLRDLLHMGVKEGLLAHRMRTFLTMLGIIIGVSSVIAMSSFSLGSKQKQADQIRALGANMVRIVDRQWENERLVEARAAGSRGLAKNDLEIFRKSIPQIARSACQRQIKLNVTHSLGELTPRVLGVEGDYLAVNNLTVAEGRFFDTMDSERSSSVAVIGAGLAKNLRNLREKQGLPPDASLLGEPLYLAGVPYVIVGILSEKQIDTEELEVTSASDPNRDLLIPLQTLLSRTAYLDIRSEIDEIQLQLEKEEDLTMVGRAVRTLLETTHGGVEDYDLVIPMDLLKQKQQASHLLDILTIIIASISIVVGGIGIMNIMLASVTERIREIGIRRAIGATQMDITRQFLTESMIISVTGGLFGVLFSMASVILVCRMIQLPVVFSYSLILVAVFASTMTGLVFGIYPALQAARKNPVESLRSE